MTRVLPRQPAGPRRDAAARTASRAAAGGPTAIDRYLRVRAQSLALAAPLSEADAQVQSMADASPTKWHLAHVTWFFETFVLERFEAGFRPFHPAFRILFNSYYNGIGEQFPRPQRGLVTRPGLAEVKAYRAAVDERMVALLSKASAQGRRMRDEAQQRDLAELIELGLQHEQQHQELILTDLKHLLSCNPMAPAYRPAAEPARAASVPHRWLDFAGGLVEIGHDGQGFAFDNETPRHPVHLRPYALGNRLVTQGEWLEFVDDGGYAEPRWWLAAGWDWVRQQRIEAPLYWRRKTSGNGRGASRWTHFTLHGEEALDARLPVVHVSLYEADAYARWRAAASGEPIRLPDEAEWEHAAQSPPHAAGGGVAAAIAEGNFVDSDALHPTPPRLAPDDRLLQLFGDAWEWTASSYRGYPGFRPWPGAAGEYNGKFMIDQYVLRGGSCATPRDHIRASYRNFFPAEARWQFSGVRLARDLE